MFRNFVFTTAAVASLWSSNALAADAVNEVPSAPAAVESAEFSWAGGYAGIHGGYGWMDSTLSAGGTGFDDNFDGGRLGGFGGWNFDVGHNVILGVEADVNYDWNENSYIGDVDVRTEVSGSIRGRAGYAVDRALFFAAGGFTATKGYIDAPVGEYDDTFTGWTVGAGVDFALTKNIFTRVEYRYNDYGKGNIAGIDFDTTQHVVNVGLAVKF